MKVTKTPRLNEYKFEGLTLGKLMAIQSALNYKNEHSETGVGPVGFDIMTFLNREMPKLEQVPILS